MMTLHLERVHLRECFDRWNDAFAEVREFIRKRNLLWRTISHKTRKAMERAFDIMRVDDEWEMEESLDGGKTWVTRKVVGKKGAGGKRMGGGKKQRGAKQVQTRRAQKKIATAKLVRNFSLF